MSVPWVSISTKGYRCLDLKTNKIIISRHVYFDEDTFPAANQNLSQVSSYTFLNAVDDPSPLFKEILQSPLPQNQPPPPQTLSVPMNTRSKSGITKPKKVLSLVTTAKAPLPKSHNQALLDPNWNPAMTDEYDAMTKTKSWNLVPRPPQVNIVRSMWLFRHKYDADGVLS